MILSVLWYAQTLEKENKKSLIAIRELSFDHSNITCHAELHCLRSNSAFKKTLMYYQEVKTISEQITGI